MDLEGKNYYGTTIYCNFDKEFVDISMRTYIPKYLKRFLHPAPQKLCYAPHKWTVPSYGQHTQYKKGPDNTPPIDDKGTKETQAKVGLLFHYSW